jgi:hypothetical protein
VPPAETCNEIDDDCDGGLDEGCCSADPCTTSCGSEGELDCTPEGLPGDCIPPAETCNGVDDDCDDETDEGCCVPGSCTTACGSTGDIICNPDGSYGGCAPPDETCNGDDDDCDSVCENGFACCSGATMSCVDLGYDSGIASCAEGCSEWDTSACAFCGNGRIDPGEDCDGVVLGGETCTTIPGGFDGGDLACTGSCDFDTAGCTSSWNPSGTYTVSPAIDFSCAYGLVTLDVSLLLFNDTGVLLYADMGSCVMQGTSSIGSRTFDISCTLPGTCAETYSLTGSFTDDDHWTATMTATFVGSLCLDCTNQSWDVTGSRT